MSEDTSALETATARITERWSVWPLVLKTDEVAALIGVTPAAVRHRLLVREMWPAPFAKNPPRWLRSDVGLYLSDRDRVVRDWKHPRPVGERAEPAPIRTGQVREPVTDLRALPMILKLRDMAAVLRLPERRLRKALGSGDMLPFPIAAHPWRWSRLDVERYLERAGDLERWAANHRALERAQAERERTRLQGDPSLAFQSIETAIKQMATTEGTLESRMVTAIRGLSKIRERDLPLSCDKAWKPIAVAIEDGVSADSAAALARGLWTLRFRLLVWLEARDPGKLYTL